MENILSLKYGINEQMLFSGFIKSIAEKEIDFVKKVISLYLGRECTLDDAKRVARIYKGIGNLSYTLLCDGVELGTVYTNFEEPKNNDPRNFNSSTMFTVRFIPTSVLAQFPNLEQ